MGGISCYCCRRWLSCIDFVFSFPARNSVGKRKQGKLGVLLLVKPVKMIFILYQGLLIASTLVNVFYWFIAKKTIFFTSIILILIPIDRFSISHDIFHLFVSMFFFALTVFLYIKMIPELLWSPKIRLPYTLASIFWLCVSTWATMNMGVISKNSLIESVPDGMKLFIVPIISAIISLIFVIVIWGVRREERFQLRATGYEQISRTAAGSPAFVTACMLLCLVMWYLELPITPQYVLFVFCLIVLVIILVAIILETRKLSKKEVVTEKQKKKLVVIQAGSFIAYLLSLAIIIILNKFVKV